MNGYGKVFISKDDYIYKNKLKNKLTYYICNEKDTPDVKIHLLIKIGSKSEKPQEIGVSHFLEHMCLAFNKAKFKEHRVCGYTSFEEINFCIYSKADNKSIHEAIDIVEGIFTGEIIDKDQLEDVRSDIASEWYKQMEGDYFRKRNRIYSKLLPHSLLERLPIGSLTNINKMDINTLYQFHNDYFVTELAALICVGDFSNIDIECVIREKFKNVIRRTPGVRRVLSTDSESKYLIINNGYTQGEIAYEIYTLQKNRFISQIQYCKNYLIEELVYLLLQRLITENDIQCTKYRYYKNRITAEYEILSVELKLKDEMPIQVIQNLIDRSLLSSSNFTVSNDLLLKITRQIDEKVQEFKSQRNNLAQECVNNYLFDEPILSWQDEVKIMKEILPKITVEDIRKKIMKCQGKNQICF